MKTIKEIKNKLEMHNIKDNVKITQSQKNRFYLDIDGNKDIFRVFNTLKELKTYLFNLYKIKEVLK